MPIKSSLAFLSYALGVMSLILCWLVPKGPCQHVTGLLALLFITGPAFWHSISHEGTPR